MILKRRHFLKLAGVTTVSALVGNVSAKNRPQTNRPNILLITSEDNGPELSCYGDPNVRTPHLDKLAAEGTLFKNAYITQAVCSPSRSSIFTGLYPHQNGQIGLATHKYAMFKKFPNIVSLLKKSGYRTGMLGKIHVNPESAFPLDYHPIKGANFGKRNMADYADKAADFFTASEESFFLMVNYPDAHLPFIKQQFGLPETPLTGKDVQCMPFMGVDTPRLRDHVANYYNCISRLDSGIGMLMNELQKSGKADNTLVIYLGDHGAQVTRGKVTCYESGLKVPFIVRWPHRGKPEQKKAELISSVDILPTVLEVTGIDAPKGLAGKSLVPLLEGQKVTWRKYLFAERTSDSPHWFFPQRTVRDERYKLIANLLQDRTNPVIGGYRTKWKAGMPTEEALSKADKLVQQGYKTWEEGPAVELYDLKNDSHEFNNVADNPEYAAVKNRLLSALRKWQKETNDQLTNPKVLKKLTNEQDAAVGTNYRRNKKFKWGYLDYLEKGNIE